MLIPIEEIQENDAHYKLKAEVNISLEYQLEKVIWLSNKLGDFLDDHGKTDYFYVNDKKYTYTIDSLLHNISVLIEYYYGWIIFSYIGTNQHTKPEYKAIKNTDAEIEKRISEIFKRHNIGALKIATKENYYAECVAEFKRAFSFLFVNEFHEPYVVNNYIKHNRVAVGYAPKGTINGETVCIPYIYFIKRNKELINPSVLRCFFDYKLSENMKLESDPKDYYVDILNKNSKRIGSFGGLTIVSVLGIEYLIKGTSEPIMVGISIESIIELSQKLSRNIIKIAIKSGDGNQAKLKKLLELMQREPKTITNISKKLLIQGHP